MAERLTCLEVNDLAAGYVLYALDADEALAVAEHLSSCPEPHPEFEELGSVVPYLDDTIELVEPPVELRARIMAAAAGDVAPAAVGAGVATGAESAATAAGVRSAVAAGVDSAAAAPAPSASSTPVATVPSSAVSAAPVSVARSSAPIPFPVARHRLVSWAIGIAAVLAIVALGGWNLMLQQNLSTAHLYQDHVTQVLAAGTQPGWRVVVMSTPGGPHGIAALPPSGTGQLVLSGLPPTPAGHVYEAWVISNGGAPAPAGWFTADSSGIGYLDAVRGGSTGALVVGITLEATADPPTPTLPMLTSGSAPAGSQSGIAASPRV